MVTKYLAWLFVGRPNFAVRYNPCIKRFYNANTPETNAVRRTKAVAHKMGAGVFFTFSATRSPLSHARPFSETQRAGGLGQ